jgi:hypothetical protein
MGSSLSAPVQRFVIYPHGIFGFHALSMTLPDLCIRARSARVRSPQQLFPDLYRLKGISHQVFHISDIIQSTDFPDEIANLRISSTISFSLSPEQIYNHLLRLTDSSHGSNIVVDGVVFIDIPSITVARILRDGRLFRPNLDWSCD